MNGLSHELTHLHDNHAKTLKATMMTSVMHLKEKKQQQQGDTGRCRAQLANRQVAVPQVSRRAGRKHPRH